MSSLKVGESGTLSGVRVRQRYSPNRYWGCRPERGITVHHTASTSPNGCEAFASPSRQASAHYHVFGKNVDQWVSEADGAWHGGADFPNRKTIGIETMNSTGSPHWKVADDTFDTLARLMADIAMRHGWKTLKVGVNVWGHRDFSSTACPGPYLYPRLGELVELANKYIKGREWDEMATYEEVKKAVIAGGVAYKNERMNGKKDVYQLITDIHTDVAEIKKRLEILEEQK